MMDLLKKQAHNANISLIIGLKCVDGIILGSDRRINLYRNNKFIGSRETTKVFKGNNFIVGFYNSFHYLRKDNTIVNLEEVFKLILENFDTTKLNREATEKIYQIIKKFVEGFSYKIFDGNYSFFNIYRSLKKLWDEYIILELPDMNFSYIELLLQFDELPDESKKEKIRHDFATIENKNTSIAEKMQDSITVIAHYSYDLPKYVPKKDLK